MTAAVWDIARQVREVGGRVHRAWSEVHPVAETCGHYACIWPMGRGLVLKLTFDPNDVRYLSLASRKKWPGFARVRHAFSLGTEFPGYQPLRSPPPLPLWGALVQRCGTLYGLDAHWEDVLAHAITDAVRAGDGSEHVLKSMAGIVLSEEDREWLASRIDVDGMSLHPDDIDERFPGEYLDPTKIGSIMDGLRAAQEYGLPLPDLHVGNIKAGAQGQIVVIDAGVPELAEAVPFPRRFDPKRLRAALGKR